MLPGAVDVAAAPQAITGKVLGLLVHSWWMMQAGGWRAECGRKSPSVTGEVMRARWFARAAFVLVFASAAVLIGFPERHAWGGLTMVAIGAVAVGLTGWLSGAVRAAVPDGPGTW